VPSETGENDPRVARVRSYTARDGADVPFGEEVEGECNNLAVVASMAWILGRLSEAP